MLQWNSHCLEKILLAVKSVLKPFVNVSKQLELVHVVKPLSKYQQFATQLEYTQGLWPYPEIDLV
jgi:hypothetical protein